MLSSTESFYRLNQAIKMGIRGNSNEVLFAKITANGTFFVILQIEPTKNYDFNVKKFLKSDEYLKNLIDEFPAICEKYNVIPLPGKTEFATRTVIATGEEIVYEFYVHYEDMHRILMNESESYAGYHSLGSVLLLVDNPHLNLLKPKTICISPVLPLEGNRFILRNGGCNFLDTLATQISFIIRQYIDPSIPLNQCFGHGGTPVIEKILVIGSQSNLWFLALECLNIERFSYQSDEGLSEITLQEDKQNCVVEMDHSAREIYTHLGAASPDELDQLKSLEIPTIDYLNAILKYQEKLLKAEQKNLSSTSKKSNTGFFRDSNERSQGLRRGIEAIQKICNELQEQDTGLIGRLF